VRVSADSFCQGNILSIYELITRVKCSAHQREKEFTEGGIFTRVASLAGVLQRRVKFTFDARGRRAERRSTEAAAAAAVCFLCARMQS
jgi:hypothetical protein